jgi:hypothetical protein
MPLEAGAARQFVILATTGSPSFTFAHSVMRLIDCDFSSQT